MTFEINDIPVQIDKVVGKYNVLVFVRFNVYISL